MTVGHTESKEEYIIPSRAAQHWSRLGHRPARPLACSYIIDVYERGSDRSWRMIRRRGWSERLKKTISICLCLEPYRCITTSKKDIIIGGGRCQELSGDGEFSGLPLLGKYVVYIYSINDETIPLWSSAVPMSTASKKNLGASYVNLNLNCKLTGRSRRKIDAGNRKFVVTPFARRGIIDLYRRRSFQAASWGVLAT